MDRYKLTHSEIELRPFEHSDFDAWLPLWHGYLSFYNSELSDDITALSWARFFEPDEMIFGVGAFDCDKLIGIAHYTFHRSTWSPTHYCYLEDLFADPAVRGKGVGRALIEEVRRCAELQKCSRLYWVTDKNNQTARTLYDKFSDVSDFVQYRIGLDEKKD